MNNPLLPDGEILTRTEAQCVKHLLDSAILLKSLKLQIAFPRRADSPVAIQPPAVVVSYIAHEPLQHAAMENGLWIDGVEIQIYRAWQNDLVLEPNPRRLETYASEDYYTVEAFLRAYHIWD
jgi:hypothetical protein